MRRALLLAAFSISCIWAGAPEHANSRAVKNCATCHSAQAVSHPQTSMAHALESIAECAILQSHQVLEYRSDPYSYRIERKGEDSFYTVTDGRATLTAKLLWAVGLGFAGQTYLYETNGELYQSRVSFYRDSNRLDETLGATNAKPINLTDAAGQLMAHDDKTACFGCHATHAVQHNELTLAAMTPGVQCERCHGDGESHVTAMRAGDAAAAKMPDLKSYSAEQISTFCGQCHRTWEQIAISGIHGVVNVRFQPYRLANSKCYDPDDRRISCVGCHNPHEELNRSDASYDSKCLVCHTAASHKGAVCKVSANNCVSCHMPKVNIPGAHHAFTDHQIRIARANEPYPD